MTTVHWVLMKDLRNNVNRHLHLSQFGGEAMPQNVRGNMDELAVRRRERKAM